MEKIHIAQSIRTAARSGRPVRHILVTTDFSACADHALAYALDLARRQGATVHLLHVMNMVEGDHHSPLRYTPEAAVNYDTPDKAVYDLLTSAIAAHDTAGVRVEPVKLRGTAVAHTLVEYARREAIDLIVIGTHGRRGFKHFMLGSVAEEVVRRAGCDVLTVREGAARDEVQVRRILVALDLSSHSAALLQRARETAASYGAALDVLHVIDTRPLPVAITGVMTVYDLVPNLREQALDHMRRLLAKTGGPEVPAALHVEEGHPPSAIVDAAIKYGVDLIMVGRQGLSAMERFFLGSVAERVVRTAESPVLVVRTEEAEAVPEPAVQEVEQAE